MSQNSSKRYSFYLIRLLFKLLVMEWLMGVCGSLVSGDLLELSTGDLRQMRSEANPVKFGEANNSITAVLPGDSAKLACPIPSELFGTKVSWIRRRDFQLLSVGEKLNANDNRFFVSHSRHSHYQGSRHSQLWFLHLLNVTKDDEGNYECQTSSHPHVSIFAYLKVQNACSEIIGPPVRVVASGSSLKLRCSLKNSTTKPSHVFWYQDSKMVNYDIERGFHVETGLDYSALSVSSASSIHSGNYTCQPSNTMPSSVLVHVAEETSNGDSIIYQKGNKEGGSTDAESNTLGAGSETSNDKASVRQLHVKSASSEGPRLVPQILWHMIFGVGSIYRVILISRLQ